MELVLNLIWCAIAIAAAMRFVHWSRGRSAAGTRFLVGIATVCVLALLFPIISATDDIHIDPAMAEETSAVRRSTVSASSDFHHILSLAAELPASSAQHFALAVIAVPVSETTANVLAGFGGVCALRGPPSSQR